ncbi:MAG: helix-hairpin-helix domain-containing protein [Clostridiales bacterium]|nr:helix-hairpin-helix domain-containing protein [Clostridiales bacterium]
MKRWMVTLLCMAWLFLSACNANPDVILQNDVSAAEDESSLSGTSSAEEATGKSDGSSLTESEEDPGEDSPAGTAEDTSAIFVYICGAVNSPGVYELASGDRVYQLVELAGGMTEDAAQQSVNLAQTVEDGEMIYVPTVDESAGETTAANGSASAAGSEDADSSKVNINTATAAELTTLNGIGDAKAAAIVAYREEHGAFTSAEEIMQVDGIAEATYNKIKDDITV